MKALSALLAMLVTAQSHAAILATDEPFSYTRASQVRKGMTPEQVAGLYLQAPTIEIFFHYEEAKIQGVVWEYLDMLGNTIRIYFRCSAINVVKNICTDGKVYKTSTDYDTWINR